MNPSPNRCFFSMAYSKGFGEGKASSSSWMKMKRLRENDWSKSILSLKYPLFSMLKNKCLLGKQCVDKHAISSSHPIPALLCLLPLDLPAPAGLFFTSLLVAGFLLTGSVGASSSPPKGSTSSSSSSPAPSRIGSGSSSGGSWFFLAFDFLAALPLAFGFGCCAAGGSPPEDSSDHPTLEGSAWLEPPGAKEYWLSDIYWFKLVQMLLSVRPS